MIHDIKYVLKSLFETEISDFRVQRKHTTAADPSKKYLQNSSKFGVVFECLLGAYKNFVFRVLDLLGLAVLIIVLLARALLARVSGLRLGGGLGVVRGRRGAHEAHGARRGDCAAPGPRLPPQRRGGRDAPGADRAGSRDAEGGRALENGRRHHVWRSPGRRLVRSRVAE